MKKEILSAIGIIAGILFGTTLSLFAQERLSLKQCREMALKYNKEMAAADRQTEAARLMSLSYKANFFPNLPPTEQGFTALPMEVSAFRAVSPCFHAQPHYGRTGIQRFRLFPRVEPGL